MWTNQLIRDMRKNYIYKDSIVVVIEDKFPKAKCHLLVLPVEDIQNLKALNGKHIMLLKYMNTFARAYVKKHKPNYVFRYGFHAEPSMNRLHLHVISYDMQSKQVKTKKHYNSFTTPFFIDIVDVIQQLKTNKSVNVPNSATCREMLSQNMVCHQCGAPLRNIPDLKRHQSSSHPTSA